MSRFKRSLAILILAVATSAEAAAATRGVTVGIEAAKAKAARNKAETEAQTRRQTQAKLQTQQQARLRSIAARRALARAEERRRAAEIQTALQHTQGPAQEPHLGLNPGKALANYKKWVASRPRWQTFQGVVPPSELRRFEPKHELPQPTPAPCRNNDGDEGAADAKPHQSCPPAGS